MTRMLTRSPTTTIDQRRATIGQRQVQAQRWPIAAVGHLADFLAERPTQTEPPVWAGTARAQKPDSREASARAHS